MKISAKLTHVLSASIISCFILLSSLPARATGIPTFDAGTIAQLVNNALEAAQHAQDLLDYYKKLYEGNFGLGGDKSTIEQDTGLPEEWKNIYRDNQTDVEKSRDEYGLTTNDKSRQEEYDNYLHQMQFYKNIYSKNIERANRVRQLATLLNSAQTPQQKEDVNNKLAYELLELQADQQSMQDMDRLLNQQEKLRQKQKENNFNKMMFGDSQ